MVVFGRTLILLRITNDTEIIPNVTVSGGLKYPDGRKISISFRDDGTDGDYENGDGVFTAVFTDTQEGGLYIIEIAATGELGGVTFTRSDEAYFEVVSEEEEKKEAFFAGLIYDRDYASGDTVSGFFYVGNEGNVEIDDELHYTVKGPTGEWMYRKWEPIYLEPDEIQYLKFSWEIPEDAPSGLYHLTVEFDDLDIEGFPLSKWFRVS